MSQKGSLMQPLIKLPSVRNSPYRPVCTALIPFELIRCNQLVVWMHACKCMW